MLFLMQANDGGTVLMGNCGDSAMDSGTGVIGNSGSA
jgi:hypothetical protein